MPDRPDWMKKEDAEEQAYAKSQSGKGGSYALGTDGKYYPKSADGKSLEGGKGVYFQKYKHPTPKKQQKAARKRG
jgi:hypothetical protein